MYANAIEKQFNCTQKSTLYCYSNLLLANLSIDCPSTDKIVCLNKGKYSPKV